MKATTMSDHDDIRRCILPFISLVLPSFVHHLHSLILLPTLSTTTTLRYNGVSTTTTPIETKLGRRRRSKATRVDEHA